VQVGSTDQDSGPQDVDDQQNFDIPEAQSVEHPRAHLWTAEARAEMRKSLQDGLRLARIASRRAIIADEPADGPSPPSEPWS
jgi:hypothetical protein